MRVFERAWRKSELPVSYSHGFNPRIRQSFGLPLVVGATSDCEYGDIHFQQWVNVRDVQEKLEANIHPSIHIEKAIIAPTLKTSLMQLLRYSDYQMTVADGSALSTAVERFRAADKVLMMKKTKHNEKEIDIKPLVRRLELLDERTITMRLSSGEAGNLKPMEFLRMLDASLEPVRLHRLASLNDKEEALF